MRFTKIDQVCYSCIRWGKAAGRLSNTKTKTLYGGATSSPCAASQGARLATALRCSQPTKPPHSVAPSRPSSADSTALFDYWLDVHIPNVRRTMEDVGGFRYVVSHSLTPDSEPFAGMAELYFTEASGWARYLEHFQPDDMGNWTDGDNTLMFHSGTEMVGIP